MAIGVRLTVVGLWPRPRARYRSPATANATRQAVHAAVQPRVVTATPSRSGEAARVRVVARWMRALVAANGPAPTSSTTMRGRSTVVAPEAAPASTIAGYSTAPVVMASGTARPTAWMALAA